MTKDDITKELNGVNAKIRFIKQSPYMKNRYKPEFVTPEAWIYTGNSKHGYLITEEEFENKSWQKAFFNMIRNENKD